MSTRAAAPSPAGPAPTAARIAPPPIRAVLIVADHAVRACLPRRRRLGLILPALGAVLFGVLAQALVGAGETRQSAFAAVASSGIFGIVLPIGCLVVGDAVLGAEVRSGTLHFTVLSPVPRWTVVLGRWLAGTVVAAIVLAVASAVAAFAAGVPDEAWAMAVAVAAGCAGYIAVFVMLGAATRRSVPWSLAVIILIERLLGAALDGIAQLSPGWLARAAFGGLVHADDLFRKGVPFGWGAVSRLAIVTAVALAFASRRLGKVRLAGRSD